MAQPGSVDTSVILGGDQANQNPFQQASQMAQTMGGIAQAQGQIRDLRAKQAIGQIIQQNTDQSGQTNWLKVQADAAQDPRAAYGMNALTQDVITRSTGAQTLAAARRTAMVGALGPLYGSGASQADIAGVMGQLVKTGVIDPNSAAATLGTMPQDPKQLDPWMKENFFLPNLGPEGAVKANYGQVVNVPTGGGTQPTVQNVVAGTSTPIAGGFIPNTLTPGEKATRVATVINGPGGVPQPASVAQSDLVTPTGESKSSAIAPGGVLPTAAPAGVAEAAAIPAASSATAFSNFRNDVATSAPRVLTLQKALAGLQGAKTGPGTNEINNVKSFLLAQSPDWLKGVLPGTSMKDIEDIKSYDEANKYLMAVAQAQSGAFGQSTDAKLASAITSNASTHISNLAAQDVVKVNIALERMKQAQFAAFQKTGLPAAQFADWAAKWATQVDPRAFEVDMLSPQERKAMIDKMPPKSQERANFFQGVRAAHDAQLPGITEMFQ